MAPDDGSTADRAARARLVMDAVLAAATSADPVVRVDTPSVPGQHWTSSDVTLTVEIKVDRLPGGRVTAFPTYRTSDGLISEDPPFVLDPADPQGSLTLAAEVERLLARVGGSLEAWQVRATEPGLPTGLPADEPWL